MKKGSGRSEHGRNPDDYHVRICGPGDLTSAEVRACVAIVGRGAAVDPEAARTELPLSRVLAVARREEEIVGVGAIKRIRSGYASTIAKRSGYVFPPDTPELGYVAVNPRHQGNALAHRIVSALLSQHRGFLFATTFDERMKKTLAKAGFVQKGQEWKGKTAPLSLWTRE